MAASVRHKAACDAAALCAVLVLCAVPAAAQRRYETVPRPEPAWETDPGAPEPDREPERDRSPDASGVPGTATGRVGPHYDTENRRFGGTNRNPYHGGSGGYRGRFSSTEFGYNRYDPNRKVEDDGILAGWVPELQGRERPQSKFIDRFVQVQTRLGPVTGFSVELYDKPGLPQELWPANLQLELQKQKLNVTCFLGIPYAQPPVDIGRFKPPRAHPGWQTWSALEYRPACPQPVRYVGIKHGIKEINEDCLYLNIFTPSISSNVQEKYAVMFYIHGGEFTHGASNLFPAHLLSAWGEVVVVTFNYRLGALGFLSTGDEYSPGNYGMLDQAMALRWVYENVHYFNGDRRRITVFGPGSGAASGGLLAVSPKTSHMVHQVIAESGSPLAEWAAIYDIWRVQNTSRIFGEKIGCNIDTSYKLLNCLNKGRSATEIGSVEFKPDVGTFPWAPYIETNTTFPGNDWYEEWRQDDWRFLPDFPERLIRRREFREDLRLLAGVNRDEAAFFVRNNRTLAPDYIVTQKILDQKIREWVKQYNYTLNPEGVYEAIRYMYTYWPDPRNTTWIREMYIDFLSDALYKAPVDSLVKLMVDLDVPTYQYVLNTTVEALRAPLWLEVPHDLEYYFLTGAPFMDPEFFAEDVRIDRQLWTEGDRNMSQVFMETFSNFAKYGRPTPKQIFNLINWQPALKGDLRYLSINNTFNSTMFSNYRQTECAFWTEYLPTVVGHLVPTYRPSTEFWWEPKEPLQIAFWSVTSLAFLLCVIVGICCCLWQGAKKKTNHLYEESFMDDAFDVRENSHFAAKSSKPPSVATLPGSGTVGTPSGLDAPRHDARSLSRDIQMDKRRRQLELARPPGAPQEEGFRELLVRDPPARVPSSQAQSATELEPLRGAVPLEPFGREPSRASVKSRDTVQYATLEHTGRLGAEAPPALNESAPPAAGQPPRDPRRVGGVSVLPAGAADRVHPKPQLRPQEGFVAHAKSIPDMLEREPAARPPARPRSTEALDREPGSAPSSRPGTPKVPHFQFVEPYDVVQLPDDYQYNSNPNLAAPPERPRTPRAEAEARLRPAGYVPPEMRPVQPQPQPQPAAPRPAHQAQIVVQLASRPREASQPARESAPSLRPNGQPPAGTPPPAYHRRTAPPAAPPAPPPEVIYENVRPGAETPASSYPPTLSERSLPETPSAVTDRSFDSAETEVRGPPRRYVPPETDL